MSIDWAIVVALAALAPGLTARYRSHRNRLAIWALGVLSAVPAIVLALDSLPLLVGGSPHPVVAPFLELLSALFAYAGWTAAVVWSLAVRSPNAPAPERLSDTAVPLGTYEIRPRKHD